MTHCLRPEAYYPLNAHLRVFFPSFGSRSNNGRLSAHAPRMDAVAYFQKLAAYSCNGQESAIENKRPRTAVSPRFNIFKILLRPHQQDTQEGQRTFPRVCWTAQFVAKSLRAGTDSFYERSFVFRHVSTTFRVAFRNTTQSKQPAWKETGGQPSICCHANVRIPLARFGDCHPSKRPQLHSAKPTSGLSKLRCRTAEKYRIN